MKIINKLGPYFPFIILIFSGRGHYLDVRKKRSRNEFEEDIDRELE